MDPKFLIERNGKPFVLYAGLLDAAHAQGLSSIRTHLVQVPMEENGQTAIVTAEVVTERGTYSGIGDASPANVSRQMLTCTIRLAETRAKARALRDAINVGVTAFEEIDGEPNEVGAPQAAAQPTPRLAAASPAPTTAPARPSATGATTDLAPPGQIVYLEKIAKDAGMDPPALLAFGKTHGVAAYELATRAQADTLIAALKRAAASH